MPWIIVVAKHLEKWLSEVQYYSFSFASVVVRCLTDILLFLFFSVALQKSATLVLLFVVLAQWSATKKLQGERVFQTTHSRRYLWTLFSLIISVIFTVQLICDASFSFCSFRDQKE